MYFADMWRRAEKPMYIKTTQENRTFRYENKNALLTQLAVNVSGSMTKYGENGTRCKDL